MCRLVRGLVVGSALVCAGLSSQVAVGQAVDAEVLKELHRRVPPDVPLEDDGPPGALVEARLRIAARNFNAALDRIFPADPKAKADRTSIRSLVEWSARCVEARLEAADRDSERRLAYGFEAARFRKIEELVRERSQGKNTVFTEEDIDRVMFHRLGLDHKQATIGR
jgi:hypothetical protein